jgi:hypothetical protein
MGGDYLANACQFREASITGTFAADLGSFEAHETEIYGPPGREFTVVRLHRAHRR